MNININSNNINFGWSCETHKAIMDAALKDFPEFNQYKDVFNDYVQRPDHDDIGFMANKHFYFGDNEDKLELSTKSIKEPSKAEQVVTTATSNGLAKAFKKIFNTDGVSFMDYNGKNNAKSAYESQVDGIYYAVEDGDSRWAIESAARASHFLQDMTQPQHIENTTALGKAADLKIHNDFENKITANNEIMTKNYFLNSYNPEADEEKTPRNFSQLFKDTFHSTKGIGKITKENEKDWDKIGQKQFDTAVTGTREILKNLSKMMGLS